MLFTISGKHVEIPEAVRAHAKKKTSKLPKYYSGINQVEVIIDCDRNNNACVEIIARGEHKKIFIVKETDKDVYRCIDFTVHKLERQLRKTKAKERDDKRSGSE